jgi:hypothetical protein
MAVAAPAHISAQALPTDENIAQDDALLVDAKRYAPIVWPAVSEPAYPMMPHPFAFDGIDNDCDLKRDLEDEDEVDVESSAHDPAQMVDLLYEARAAASEDVLDTGAPGCGQQPWRAYGRDWSGRAAYGPQPTVLFVGPEDREAVPSWNEGRSADPDTWDDRVPRHTQLLQYWFYYPFDRGPNGHRHDGEHLAVYTEPVGGRIRRVRALVGAGHEANSVNNVLVAAAAGAAPRGDLVLPRELPQHPGVLVELGKHASAPDVTCNGVFDLGADANIYAESVWGVRDVWSGTPGKALKVGKFESWFSFPRTPESRLILDGWWEDAHNYISYLESCRDLVPADLQARVETNALTSEAPSRKDDRRRGTMDPFAEWRSALNQTVTGASAQRRREWADHARAGTYRLVRVKHIYDLYDLLASPRCEDDGACRVALEDFFNRPDRLRAFWGDRQPPKVVVAPATVPRLKTWTAKFKNWERRDVWRHEAFRKPQSDFRLWLFQRVGLGIEPLKVEAGNSVFGALLMVTDVPTHDSRLEAYVHYDGIGKEPFGFYDVGINYYPSRVRMFDWYVGVGYSEALETHWNGSAGVEVHLTNVPWLKLPRRLSVAMYAGLSAEIGRPGSDPSTPTRVREADPAVFQGGVRITYGFFRPRHPLAR